MAVVRESPLLVDFLESLDTESAQLGVHDETYPSMLEPVHCKTPRVLVAFVELVEDVSVGSQASVDFSELDAVLVFGSEVGWGFFVSSKVALSQMEKWSGWLRLEMSSLSVNFAWRVERVVWEPAAVGSFQRKEEEL